MSAGGRQVFTLPFRQVDRSNRYEAQYRAWRSSFPDGYTIVERLAARAIESGRRRIGVKWLVEVARWQHEIERRAGQFKFNNNHTSLIARDLVADHPEWIGRITLRELRS